MNNKWLLTGAVAALVTGSMLYCSKKASKNKGYRKRKKVVVGSRKSPLAMVQTRYVVAKLKALRPDLEFEIVTTETKGDQVLDKPLAAIGDKGLFTQELEDKMYSGEIDMAVHSCKDLMTKLPKGLHIGAFLERHEKEDVFIASKANAAKGIKSLSQLKPGSVIGTSSLRRRAVLAHFHPELQFKDIRGNIGTRLAKLDDPANGYDGTILAHAGLTRMDDDTYSSRINEVLSAEKYMYAVAQGVLAVESRENDPWLQGILDELNHGPTEIAAKAERGLLRGLEGGCHVPLAVTTTLSPADHTLTIRGAVLSLNGTELVGHTLTGSASDPTALGHKLSEVLISEGAQAILDNL